MAEATKPVDVQAVSPEDPAIVAAKKTLTVTEGELAVGANGGVVAPAKGVTDKVTSHLADGLKRTTF